MTNLSNLLDEIALNQCVPPPTPPCPTLPTYTHSIKRLDPRSRCVSSLVSGYPYIYRTVAFDTHVVSTPYSANQVTVLTSVDV